MKVKQLTEQEFREAISKIARQQPPFFRHRRTLIFFEAITIIKLKSGGK